MTADRATNDAPAGDAVLTGRFEMDAAAAEAWEAMSGRPARDLPGLRALMERPSPFEEGMRVYL
ncbi:MAG TPA: hypothetical protein VMV92_05375 [Streptosporangiaceae bacterium]|nr:hypothetical protein [Streptosporangiaceae bacterium]